MRPRWTVTKPNANARILWLRGLFFILDAKQYKVRDPVRRLTIWWHTPVTDGHEHPEQRQPTPKQALRQAPAMARARMPESMLCPECGAPLEEITYYSYSKHERASSYQCSARSGHCRFPLVERREET